MTTFFRVNGTLIVSVLALLCLAIDNDPSDPTHRRVTRLSYDATGTLLTRSPGITRADPREHITV